MWFKGKADSAEEAEKVFSDKADGVWSEIMQMKKNILKEGEYTADYVSGAVAGSIVMGLYYYIPHRKWKTFWKMLNGANIPVIEVLYNYGVAILLYRPIITLVVCRRINRYNDIIIEKEKFLSTYFCKARYSGTINKTTVTISGYEVK